MSAKHTPRIMFVCEVCAEGAPEACGHYDASEVRRHGDKWLCEYCYEDEAFGDDDEAPLFSDLPQADARLIAAAPDLLAALKSLDNLTARDAAIVVAAIAKAEGTA